VFRDATGAGTAGPLERKGSIRYSYVLFKTNPINADRPSGFGLPLTCSECARGLNGV